MEKTLTFRPMRISAPIPTDILDELTAWRIQCAPKSIYSPSQNQIERAFQESFGCSFHAVPIERLACAIDELCRIIFSFQQPSIATVTGRKYALFQHLTSTIGYGAAVTRDEDVLAAMNVLEQSYQENVYNFLMEANRMTRPHQRMINNEIGERMDQLNAASNFLYGSGEPMSGSSMTDDEALAYARERFPNGDYCLVRDWLWVDLDVSAAGLTELTKTKRLPSIIYAHTVVYDSNRRWDVGDYVRTSPLHVHEEGFHFKTLHSVYLLLGPGTRKRATAETVARIF